MLKFQQLGNGGAFNYEDTNSSFLIDLGESYLLFDCGYSVYPKLRSSVDLNKLKYVFISHLDDDHVGSLKTLIYYQYFMNKIKLNIICGPEVYEDLKYFLNDIEGYYENYKPVKAELFKLSSFDSVDLFGVKITVTKTDHHLSCHGLMIEKDNACLFISGDTKPVKELEKLLLNKKGIFFHDFSKFNDPSRQVHACEDSLNTIYSKEFLLKLKFYHNDDSSYEKDWQEIV